jgi:hypothetical protein
VEMVMERHAYVMRLLENMTVENVRVDPVADPPPDMSNRVEQLDETRHLPAPKPKQKRGTLLLENGDDTANVTGTKHDKEFSTQDGVATKKKRAGAPLLLEDAKPDDMVDGADPSILGKRLDRPTVQPLLLTNGEVAESKDSAKVARTTVDGSKPLSDDYIAGKTEKEWREAEFEYLMYVKSDSERDDLNLKPYQKDPFQLYRDIHAFMRMPYHKSNDDVKAPEKYILRRLFKLLSYSPEEYFSNVLQFEQKVEALYTLLVQYRKGYVGPLRNPQLPPMRPSKQGGSLGGRKGRLIRNEAIVVTAKNYKNYKQSTRRGGSFVKI